MPSQPIGFVSFAGGHLKWRLARFRINHQVKISKRFDSIGIYDEKKLDGIVNLHVAEFIRGNFLGYGLWIWKPIIILDFFEKNPTCQLILYLDAGCDFNSSDTSRSKWNTYLSLLGNYGAIVFQTPFCEQSYTSKPLVEKLQSNAEDLRSGQIHAGAFFMTRSFAIDFCRDWLNLMSQENFCLLEYQKTEKRSNFYETFIDYRYDQSVFSLMMKKRRNVRILSDRETDFAPFWSAGIDFPILTSRNRSIVPVLKTGFTHRGFRKIERRLIRTYNSLNARKTRNKLK